MLLLLTSLVVSSYIIVYIEIEKSDDDVFIPDDDSESELVDSPR